MTMQRIISRVAQYVPLRVKIPLRGERDSQPTCQRRPFLPESSADGSVPDSSVRRRAEGLQDESRLASSSSFVYGSWEPEVVQSIQKHVMTGMTVLDIGAHSGFYSLLLSRLVGDGGKVFAFEPLPANFRT